MFTKVSGKEEGGGGGGVMWPSMDDHKIFRIQEKYG